MVDGTKMRRNVGEKEVSQDGWGDREGFLDWMLDQSPEALQDHIQWSVLRWRRDKGETEHFVDRPDSANVLGEASLGVDTPCGSQPDREEADFGLVNGEGTHVGLSAVLLEGFPLRRDRLKRAWSPGVLLDVFHLYRQFIVEF